MPLARLPEWTGALLIIALAVPAAMASSFVYEGRLHEQGEPAHGEYDLLLTAFGQARDGEPLAAPQHFDGVQVRDGRFRLELYLPLVQSDQLWLEVAVREAGSAAYSPIPGRSQATPQALIGACWSTTGDAGSTAANFIGTTDDQPFVVRVNNEQALRIQPNLSSPNPNPSPNLIGGYFGNAVTTGAVGATIGGGGDSNSLNRVTGNFGTIGGGRGNRAGNDVGSVSNNAFATVGGGWQNWSAGGGTVGGGSFNTASGGGSTVGGGDSNTASGVRSTVGGGEVNCAGGDFSWAGGRRAKVRPGSASGVPSNGCAGVAVSGTSGDQGTFVWADSQTTNYVSTGTNQFLVRAQGGAVITGNSSVNDPLGNRLRVNGSLRVDTLGSAGATTLCRNGTNQIASCSSSQRYKEEIVDLDLGLATLARLRAVGYRWKESGAEDVGFVAEAIADIDERFVTRDDAGEVEGVRYDRLTALLTNAVQELAARESLAQEALTRVNAENAALGAELEVLRAELDRRDADYRDRLQRLEAMIGAR